MQLKVQGGTVNSADDLCVTCRSSHITTNDQGIEERTCGAVGPQSPAHIVTRKIAACNSYSDKREPHLHQYLEIAWEITTNHRKVGFISPEDRRKAGIGPLGIPGREW